MSIQRIKSSTGTAGSRSMRWRKGRRNALADIRDGLTITDMDELISRFNAQTCTDASRLFESSDPRLGRDTRVVGCDPSAPDLNDNVPVTPQHPVRPLRSSADSVYALRFTNASIYLHRRNAVPDILAILDEGSLCRIRSRRRTIFNDPA